MPVPDTTTALRETVVGYPTDHPIQDAVELAGASRGDLGDAPDPVVKATWQTLRSVVAAYTRDDSPLLTASDVYRALMDKKLLPNYQQLWTVFVLQGNKTPRYTREPSGLVVPLRQSYPVVPKAAQLPRPERSDSYLLVARATPRVMSDHPEIATQLAALQRKANVLDVLFWNRGTDTPSMWTLKGGFGVSGDARLEFPDENLLKEATK